MVALSFSVPLGNGAVKASLGAALAEGRIALSNNRRPSSPSRRRFATRSSRWCRPRTTHGRRGSERAAGQEYQSEARRLAARGASTLFLVQQKKLAIVCGRQACVARKRTWVKRSPQLARAQDSNYKQHDIR